MASVKRENIISLRLSDNEFKVIRINAEKFGLSVSDYVRIKCLYSDCITLSESKENKLNHDKKGK